MKVLPKDVPTDEAYKQLEINVKSHNYLAGDLVTSSREGHHYFILSRFPSIIFKFIMSTPSLRVD